MALLNVLVTLSVMTILTLSSEGAKSPLDVDFIGNTPVTHGKCPPIETADFDVISNGSDSSMIKGCASFDFISRNTSLLKSFSVRFGRLNNSEPHLCVTGNDSGMEHLVFSCLSQSPGEAIDSNNGSLFTTLYGRAVKPAGKLEIRCAMYKMVEGNSMMVVSGNTSCDGLSNILSNPQAKFPKGSTLLRFNGSKSNIRRRRSTSDEKNTIKTNSYDIHICNLLPYRPECLGNGILQ